MGFGLTISQMIAKQLGGKIRVQSKENQGSTFILDILVD
jgi:signal transduction histidine kinase